MRNKLIDLNNNLFEAMERLTEMEVTDENISTEIARSKVLAEIAENIIANGNLYIKAIKLAEDYDLKLKTDNGFIAITDKE